MVSTKDKTKKQLPVFSEARCKRCGICSHFCPVEAIGVEADGMPFLADSEACTSCGLCSDMCPDWAVYLTEVGPEDAGPLGHEQDGDGGDPAGAGRSADRA